MSIGTTFCTQLTHWRSRNSSPGSGKWGLTSIFPWSRLTSSLATGTIYSLNSKIRYSRMRCQSALTRKTSRTMPIGNGQTRPLPVQMTPTSLSPQSPLRSLAIPSLPTGCQTMRREPCLTLTGRSSKMSSCTVASWPIFQMDRPTSRVCSTCKIKTRVVTHWHLACSISQL